MSDFRSLPVLDAINSNSDNVVCLRTVNEAVNDTAMSKHVKEAKYDPRAKLAESKCIIYCNNTPRCHSHPA